MTSCSVILCRIGVDVGYCAGTSVAAGCGGWSLITAAPYITCRRIVRRYVANELCRTFSAPRAVHTGPP